MEFGLIVDVETTGLNASSDKVIELGLIEFRRNQNGLASITTMYSGLQDPGLPLDAEITKITGLTDEMVARQVIDWQVVQKYWDRADVVVAHNAEFDRKFLMTMDQLKTRPKHWACSVRHIDWHDKNCSSRKLQYLAADHGFVNPFAHRALFDCATTFRLIAPHLSELLETSTQPEYDILAVGSPFETKDVLKQNGYRWDGEKKVWRKLISAKKLESEREFLAKNIYRGATRHVEEIQYFNPINVKT